MENVSTRLLQKVLNVLMDGKARTKSDIKFNANTRDSKAIESALLFLVSNKIAEKFIDDQGIKKYRIDAMMKCLGKKDGKMKVRLGDNEELELTANNDDRKLVVFTKEGIIGYKHIRVDSDVLEKKEN